MQKKIDDMLGNNYDYEILSEEEVNNLLHCLSEGEINIDDPEYAEIKREHIIAKKLNIIRGEYIELNKDFLKNKDKLLEIEEKVDNLLNLLNIDYEEREEKTKELVKKINNADLRKIEDLYNQSN